MVAVYGDVWKRFSVVDYGQEAMMGREPMCDHEKVGRVLAGSYSYAANRAHVAELAGGLVEGLGLDGWRSIMDNYRAELDANILAHRAVCEGDE